MRFDRRFDERILKAKKEVQNAFFELEEDIYCGKLFSEMDKQKLEQVYKEKANQAKILLNNCIDLLEHSGSIIQSQYPNNEKPDF